MMRHDDNADDGGYDDHHHQVREVGRLVVRDSAFLSLPTGAILIHSADQVFLDIVMIIVMTIAMNIVIVFAFRLKLLATKCLYLHLQQSQRGARYDDHPFTNHADHTFRREATDLQVSSHLLLESGFPTAKQVGWAT